MRRRLRKEIKVLLVVLTLVYMFVGLGLAEGTADLTGKIMLIEVVLVSLSFLNIYVLDIYR